MSDLTHGSHSRPILIGAAVAAILLGACAAAPVKPAGAMAARAELTALEADPNLANRAPLSLKEAESAVALAEEPVVDTTLGAHRVYLAERKVQTARAEAQTRYAEDQRTALSAQRDQAQLNARTREADRAARQAASARIDADVANANAANAQAQAASSQQQALDAQAQAANSQQQTLDAQAQAAELQQQIEALQAKVTDRGIVLTLGDVLFASGRADLKDGADMRLDKLVAFLNHYPNRTADIEGHTDSIGTDEFNQDLSQRRADAVRSYLVEQGISGLRVAATGLGKSGAVASNDSASGRQQNRRVEVIINNPSTVAR
jgi:outer membrane protein OmpA-like peptidoglycan-associated protein